MTTTKRRDPNRAQASSRSRAAQPDQSPSAQHSAGKTNHLSPRRLSKAARTGVLVAAVAAAAVTATIGTVGNWPARAAASEPTATDKLADLRFLGLGADGLLASGLSVNQAAGVLDWIGAESTRFDALRAAQGQVATAQAMLESIRSEMVRTGRTADLNTAYGQTQAQHNAAKAVLDGLVGQARAAMGTHLDEELGGAGAWPTLVRVMENNQRRVPTAFRVLELTEQEWEQVEHYHEMIEKRPEALTQQTVATVESLGGSSAVANARQRITSDLPLLVQVLFAG